MVHTILSSTMLGVLNHLIIPQPPILLLLSWKDSEGCKDVVKQASDEAPTLFSAREQFSKQICLIIMSIHISRSPFISGGALSNKLVTNRIYLLLQGAIRHGSVTQHWLVISKDICWRVDWNSHHAWLISKSTQIFTALLHSTKLAAERQAFNWVLLLAKPVNRSTLQLHNKTSPWYPRLSISCMVCVDLRPD